MKLIANNKIFIVKLINNGTRVEISAPNYISTQRAVEIDNDGNEYFYLPDLTRLGNPDYMKMDDMHFHGRPADAINAIFDGWADSYVKFGNPFKNIFTSGYELTPIYFLDRKIGKRIRAKNLASLKNRREYKWTIVRSNKCSFNTNSYYLRKDYDNLLGQFMFEHFMNIESNGYIKTNSFDNIVLPESYIYMTNTKDEAEATLKKAVDKMLKFIRSIYNDDSDIRMKNEYTYEVQQFIIN